MEKFCDHQGYLKGSWDFSFLKKNDRDVELLCDVLATERTPRRFNQVFSSCWSSHAKRGITLSDHSPHERHALFSRRPIFSVGHILNTLGNAD
jgi:hypothetical protein